MKKTKMRHILAAALFCMVMSIGFVCFADEQATVNVKNAVIRAEADPNSDKLGSVPQGKTVDVISQTTGKDGKKWYQVYVEGDKKGYIRSDLLKLKDGANVKTDDTTPATPAQNTDGLPKKGTVVNNDVRIRKGASTNDGVVATANRGMVITVTGETNGGDGKKWYQVSFTYNNKEVTGFIRSDMVTFDNVPADVAQSQITGETNAGGEEAPPETGAPETEPAETEPVQTEPQPQPQSNAKEVSPAEAAEEPYVMPGFTLFDLVDGGQKYTAYKNGSFYIIYGIKQNGEEGWFLFDSEKGIYTRYPYTTAGVEMADKKTVSIVVVIVLIVTVVVLVAIVGLLLIKLMSRSRENDSHERDYGKGKKNYRDDDMDDFEELELDDEEYRRASRIPGGEQAQGRRPQKGAAPQEPVPGRRPQPQGGNPQARPRSTADEQPRRQPQQPQGARPQGGGNPSAGARPPVNGQPQGRRPQPQGARPQGGGNPQEGARPAAGGQPQGRRPQPQGGPQGRNPQNEKVPPQRGNKAKNPADDDDGDMEFMDI